MQVTCYRFLAGLNQGEALITKRVSIMAHTTVDGRNPAPLRILKIPLFLGHKLYKAVQDLLHRMVLVQVQYRVNETDLNMMFETILALPVQAWASMTHLGK